MSLDWKDHRVFWTFKGLPNGATVVEINQAKFTKGEPTNQQIHKYAFGPSRVFSPGRRRGLQLEMTTHTWGGCLAHDQIETAILTLLLSAVFGGLT